MKTPNFHIMAPPRAALSCFGFQKLVSLRKGFLTELLISNKKVSGIKTVYLTVFDECIPRNRLEKHFNWEKLILVYTSNFKLTQTHIHKNRYGAQAIWHIEDLNLKSISELIQLLKINHTVNSSRINKILQLPVLELDDYDLKLLTHLAKGKHTDELIPLLNSSKSTIERRKRKLKQGIFDEYTTDAGLITALRLYGYDFFN